MPAEPLAGPVESEVLRSETALRALEPEWRRLYEGAYPRNPFLSPEWCLACAGSVAEPFQPFVATLRREGRLRAVAPLRLERVCGFRVLRQLGSGWSPYGGFLSATPDDERQLLAELARRNQEWDLLLLTQLAEPFTRLHLLPPPSGARGGSMATPWPGSAFLARDVPWEALLAEGPGWLRRMAKTHRKFEREGGTVARITGQEAVARLPEVEAVETASWQGTKGHSSASDVRKRVLRLLEGTLGALGDTGEMELWLAFKDHRTIAYEVNLLLPERLWLYRGAYDPAFGRWSPGGLLDFLSIRESWKEGRREYDFMSGGEEYKRERTESLRELKQIVLAATTARGALAHFGLVIPRELRNRLPAARRLRAGIRLLRSPRAFLPGSLGGLS